MANPEVAVAPQHTLQFAPERRLLPKIAKSAALLGIGVGSALLSAEHIGTETTIGGHRAVTTVSYDSLATFDVGMPGAIAFPQKNMFGVGAHITIKEMPADVSLGSDPSELSPEELQSYARMLTTIEDDLQNTAKETGKQAARNGLIAMAGTVALYTFVGRDARRQVYETRVMPAVRKLAPAAAVVSLLGIQMPTASHEIQLPDGFIPVSELFENTPLEGALVKGRWMQLAVNTAGVEVLDYINSNDQFYKQAAVNMQAALEDHPTFQPTNRSVTGLFITDYHCNTGMSRVIETVAEQQSIDFALDGGDVTASGTEYEELCIGPLGKALEGIDKATSLGNHDDLAVTGPQMSRAGFSVLTGQPTTLQGITILGDSDPRRSQFGVNIRQVGEESVVDIGERLAHEACAQPEPVDFLLVHDHDAAYTALQRGCAKVALSGHMHKHQVEDITSSTNTAGLLIVGASSGGAGGDMPTFGPLYDDASMVLLSVHKQTHDLLGYQILTVHPDASVTVGRRNHYLPSLLNAHNSD